jgi:hypothetical protein
VVGKGLERPVPGSGRRRQVMWMKYFWVKAEAAVFAAFVGGVMSVTGTGAFKVEWKGAVS